MPLGEGWIPGPTCVAAQPLSSLVLFAPPRCSGDGDSPLCPIPIALTYLCPSPLLTESIPVSVSVSVLFMSLNMFVLVPILVFLYVYSISIPLSLSPLSLALCLSNCLSPLPSLSLPLCPSSLSLNHLHFSLTLCLCVSVPIHLRVSVSLCLYVCLQPSLCLYASSLTVGFSLFLSSSTYSCPGPDPSLWLHSLWPEPGAVLASAALSRPPVCPSFLLLDRRVSAHTSHICLPADCRERGRWLWTLGRNPFWAAVGPENAPELVNSLTH